MAVREDIRFGDDRLADRSFRGKAARVDLRLDVFNDDPRRRCGG